MSGPRDVSLLLDDIVDAVARLIDLGRSVPAGTIGTDLGHSEMIMWNLVVLGEATKRLDHGTRARFDQIPWNAMARTRDRIAHHYEDVDWETVTTILGTDLPLLLPQLGEIRDILRAEFDAG